MSGPTRIPHILNTALLAAIWSYALSTFGTLPDRIPVHFGLSGAPDRWVETSFGTWFSLPIMALLVTGILYASSLVTLLGVRRPGVVSMPARYRERFLALSPEERKPILERVRALVLWMAVPSNALQAWTLFESHAVATGERATGRFAIATAVCLASVALILALGLRSVFRALRGDGGGHGGPGRAA